MLSVAIRIICQVFCLFVLFYLFCFVCFVLFFISPRNFIRGELDCIVEALNASKQINHQSFNLNSSIDSDFEEKVASLYMGRNLEGLDVQKLVSAPGRSIVIP